MITNKKILVTGAGGFIGSRLALKLFEQKNFVRVVDVKWNGYLPRVYSSEQITLDLREKDSCQKATAGIDYVFNLAATMDGIDFITDIGADIMHDNVMINTHIARTCVNNSVSRLFFSSSACVYPTYRQKEAQITPLKEDDAYPADPDNFYGWEKLYAEKDA